MPFFRHSQYQVGATGTSAVVTWACSCLHFGQIGFPFVCLFVCLFIVIVLYFESMFIKLYSEFQDVYISNMLRPYSSQYVIYHLSTFRLVWFLPARMYIMCMLGTCGGQKRGSDLPESEFWMSVNYHKHSGS